MEPAADSSCSTVFISNCCDPEVKCRQESAVNMQSKCWTALFLFCSDPVLVIWKTSDRCTFEWADHEVWGCLFTARQECGSVCAVGSRWKMSNSSDGRKKSPAHIRIWRGESREFPKAGGFFKKKKKAGTLQDAGEHKAGGGVGGGRHTRVWWVSCQLTWRKLRVQPEKMCVRFNFQPKYPKRTTHTLHIQAWIQDRKFRATGGAPQQTEWKRWNRSHGAEGGWKSLGGRGGGGAEGRTWFMRPVSGIIERRRDAAEAGGQTERESGRS